MLNPLYTAISWILLRWHSLLSYVLPRDSGVTWALSIALLVITLRVLLFRFFVRQVRTQRKMQELQPKIAALRAKYKNDRRTLSQEMMKLNQEAGVNPLAGCLPILLQAPVFLALFHVLRRLGPGKAALYSWSQPEMTSASNAKLFGAPISAAFRTPPSKILELHATTTDVRLVTGVMVVLMVAATYVTQRQIMARSSSQALDPQQAMVQKLMLYGIPVSLLVSGFIFPVGVLCYWLTNNLWTMGQQFYILKKMPYQQAGAAAENKPKVDPKLLAPKPGAKPVNPRNRRPSTTTAVNGSAGEAKGSGTASVGARGARPSRSDANGRADSDSKKAADPDADSGGDTGGDTVPAEDAAASTTPPRGPNRPQPGKRPAGTRPKKKRR